MTLKIKVSHYKVLHKPIQLKYNIYIKQQLGHSWLRLLVDMVYPATPNKDLFNPLVIPSNF